MTSVSSCSCVVASVVSMILHYPQDISVAQFLHKDSYSFTSLVHLAFRGHAQGETV